MDGYLSGQMWVGEGGRMWVGGRGADGMYVGGQDCIMNIPHDFDYYWRLPFCIYVGNGGLKPIPLNHIQQKYAVSCHIIKKSGGIKGTSINSHVTTLSP